MAKNKRLPRRMTLRDQLSILATVGAIPSPTTPFVDYQRIAMEEHYRGICPSFIRIDVLNSILTDSTRPEPDILQKLYKPPKKSSQSLDFRHTKNGEHIHEPLETFVVSSENMQVLQQLPTLFATRVLNRRLAETARKSYPVCKNRREREAMR